MKAYTKLCKQVCPKLGTNYKVIKYLHCTSEKYGKGKRYFKKET